MDLDFKNRYFSLRDKIIEKDFQYLDGEQKKAVLNDNRNVLVLACPGSGKTTVLINKVFYLVKYGNIYGGNYLPEDIQYKDLRLMEKYLDGKLTDIKEKRRVSYILGQRKADPRNIIVITFTKAAAVNMKNRFEKLYKGKFMPFFGTLHGLFYKILVKRYKRVDIIESSESYKLISKLLVKFLEETSEEKVLEIKNYISLFKCSFSSIDNFDVNMNKDIFAQIYNSYENYKRDRNLLDFDDIQIKCRELFLEEPALLEFYRRAIKYILIDEFQDCDHIQLELIKLLNKSNSIFAVGDEDQSIYSFRGARPDYMVDFHKNFYNGKKLFLSTNYRSTKNIVEAASSLIKNNSMRNDKNMMPWKKEKKTIDILNYEDENSQGVDIALQILKLKTLGDYKYEDCAVLYRTNIESRSLIDAFIRKKIPFKLLDKAYNFFEHFICRDLTAYLKLSLIRDDAESFIRVINKPFRYISRSSLDKLKNSYVKEDCFEFIKNIEDTPVFQIKNIDKLKKDIYNLNRMSLLSAINFIISDLGYHDYIKEYSTKFKISISELEEVLDEFKKAAEEFKNIKDFLEHIENIEEELKESKNTGEKEDCITLSTVHGVKGMEFKNIFIINCAEETFPHKNSIESHMEEERRLMYVAMTRAIDNLFICIPRKLRGKAKEPSRFIGECGINTFEHLNEIYKIGDEVYHKNFGKAKVKSIDKNVIELDFGNNTERRFDIMVLHNKNIIRKM